MRPLVHHELKRMALETHLETVKRYYQLEGDNDDEQD
jgi:hypothetical protein